MGPEGQDKAVEEEDESTTPLAQEIELTDGNGVSGEMRKDAALAPMLLAPSSCLNESHGLFATLN